MYRSLAVFTTNTVLLNGARASSAYPSRMANPDLRWERTRQFDVGLNLNTFGNRLNFDVSWYYKYTDDLLLDAPSPISSGFNSITKNVGAVSNRGLDILVNGTIVANKDFEWGATLNANYNANRVERLNDNNADIFVGDNFVGGQIIMRVGEPLACFWGFERLGIKDAAYVAEKGGRVGTALRSKDKTIVGKGMPDWTGSFIQNFRYKNFDFSAEFQYVIGGNIRSDMTHSIEDRFGLTSGLKTILKDAWKEGKPTNVPNMVQAIRIGTFDGQDSNMDTRWVSPADYFRGSNFVLGYTFDLRQIQRLNISSLRTYVAANNLFVIHSKDFKGYDPEVSTRKEFEQNVMFFQYPVPTVFTLGFNVIF
jgi:outer membrane receptor protein involved in Fe transport